MNFVISEQPYVYKEFLMYMQTIRGKSIGTISEYALDLNIFFKFMSRHFKIDNSKNPIDEIDITNLDYNFVKKIQLTDIYEYLSYMNTVRKNSAATRARKVACLRSYFKYMHSKAKYIEDNPAKDLESPKLKQSLPNYLTLDESKWLLETVLKNSTGFRDYAIITLFLNCGMRLSELVGINLSDIKNDTLIVTGKGNKERTIYLNNACIKAIKDLSQSQPTSVTYLITPSGFDLDELNIQGYKMRISIIYDVNYKKDTLLPDFLYAGSPKYELTILTKDLIGYYEKDLTTTSKAKNKYFIYDFEIVNIKNSKITLTFSTNNVQNVIYFKNIQVKYYCYK